MKKKKTIIISSIVVLLLIVGLVLFLVFKKNKINKNIDEEKIKFAEEYKTTKDNVFTYRTIKEINKILKNGTAATIKSGVIPGSPHIFSTKATPSTAALPLADACANAPTILLSLMKILAPANTATNIAMVTIRQNQKNLGFISLSTFVFDTSKNNIAGSAILNTYLLATLANSSVRKFIFLNI